MPRYEEHAGVAEMFGGHLRRGLRVILSEDEDIKTRHGYMCVICQEEEAITEAFPERCPTCGFEMRERQSEVYSRTYHGDYELGGQLNADDEGDRAERRAWARKHNLWLPDA